MNRIKISPLASMPLVVEQSETTTCSQKPNLKFNRDDCNLFVPMHYEPNYSYPLIVWLHGDGRDQNEMLKYMPSVSTRNYVALAVGSGQQAEFGEDSSMVNKYEAERRKIKKIYKKQDFVDCTLSRLAD